MARASTAPANDTGELDELWSVPPEQFVAARTAAIKALKEAGDTKAAAELKTVKRPSPSAWLVNQLVRTAPKEVEALFGMGDVLMRAQGRVLAGADPSEMHNAMRDVRQATARAMKRANAILAEHGKKPTADLTRRVTHTLRTASLDRRLRDLVLAARLTTDPNVDEIDALSDVRVPTRVAEKKQQPKTKEASEPKRPSAREQQAAKRAAEREAKKAAQRAAREKLRAEADAAAAEMEEAKRAVAMAETAERRARAAADTAKRELAEARKALETATAKRRRLHKRPRSRS